MPKVYRADGLPRGISLTPLYENAGNNIAYVGFAAVGSLKSEAKWQIMKLDLSDGGVDTQWADSDDNYDNVWDNRASLTYGL